MITQNFFLEDIKVENQNKLQLNFMFYIWRKMQLYEFIQHHWSLSIFSYYLGHLETLKL